MCEGVVDAPSEAYDARIRTDRATHGLIAEKGRPSANLAETWASLSSGGPVAGQTPKACSRTARCVACGARCLALTSERPDRIKRR
jgi:hypothetical protein